MHESLLLLLNQNSIFFGLLRNLVMMLQGVHAAFVELWQA